MTDKKHPSHVTRISDASSFDEICVNCGATDHAAGGWGSLAKPCAKVKVDQQSVPLCPHRHGPMLFQPVGCHWYCRQGPGCGEIATPAMLQDAYERGRRDERQRLATLLVEPPVGQEDEYPNDLVERMAWITARAVRAEQVERILKDLLALIHRDGGHHTEAVVLEPSKRDAVQAWSDLLRQLDDAVNERDRLREALPPPGRLETLAAWFDARQEQEGWVGREVQRDLRVWAAAIRAALNVTQPESQANCPRCGNPLPDCQCYGSKAMAEDWMRRDIHHAHQHIAEWTPKKQAAMFKEARNIRSGSKAIANEQGDSLAQPMPTKPIESATTNSANDDAPHGRCWCVAPLEWGEDINLSRKSERKIVLCCSGNLAHKPCPNCGQWVKWYRIELQNQSSVEPQIRGRVEYIHSGETCPGPALHGYCPHHTGTPRQNHPPEHDSATGYLWCPKCEEESDVNR